MAASELPRPTRRTASRCTPQTSRGTHAFDIAGYSLHRGLGAGNFIRSAAFDVGGYSWCIRFYPDGYAEDEDVPDSREDDMAAAFLELLSKNAEVRAHYDFRLVDHATGLSASVFSTAVPQVFDTIDAKENNIVASGTDEFISWSDLRESIYLRNDRVVVECDVTVINQPRVEEEETFEVVDHVPPSDLSSDFGRLLGLGEQADVTFKVRDEVFQAHKMVVAARSPVFRAELSKPSTRETEKECITIEDMEPAVFKAFLLFIYTDSLPDIHGSEERGEIAKHLLMAADTYSVQRLKLVCEGILCKSLDARTVVTMIALAERYHCNNLKEACVGYINSLAKGGNNAEGSQLYKNLKSSLIALFVNLQDKARRLGMSLFKHEFS